MDLCRQSNVFAFNILSRFVIAFLSRSKSLLISWLQSLSTVLLELKKIKSVTVSPFICHEVLGLDAMIFIFWMLSLKSAFSLSSSAILLLIFGCKEYNQSYFGTDHLVMSMYTVISCVVGKRVFAMTSAFSWQNSISLNLLHSVLQGQIFPLLQVFLDFLLLHSSPL